MALPAILGLPLGATVIGLFGLGSSLPGLGDLLSQQLNNLFQAKIHDIASLIKQRQKGLITEEQYQSTMGYWGFSKQRAETLFVGEQSPLTPAEAMRLYFQSLAESRKIENENDVKRLAGEQGKAFETQNPFAISKEWIVDRLKENGIDTAWTDEIIQANRPTPSFDDIARFAARDVFEPEQVKLGKLAEGLNQNILDQFRKTGATDELASFVWFAHWLIPSLNQMIEFRQRLFDHPDPEVKFTDSEMDLAFKLADLAPGFRKRIQAITFTPLGRVDIRRADKEGLYGEGNERTAKLVRAYQEIGYNESDSEFQANFTIALNTRENRDLTKTEILRFYREGVFGDDRDTIASELLKDIGFNDADIEYLLEHERMLEIDDNEKAAIDTLLSRWLQNDILEESELRTELARLSLTRTQIAKEIKRFNEARIQSQRRMDNSEAEKLVRLNVIDLETYGNILEANGVIQSDIESLKQQFETDSGAQDAVPRLQDVLDWYTNDIILESEFIGLMRQIGHTDLNITRYAKSIGRGISEEGLTSLVNIEEE